MIEHRPLVLILEATSTKAEEIPIDDSHKEAFASKIHLL